VRERRVSQHPTDKDIIPETHDRERPRHFGPERVQAPGGKVVPTRDRFVVEGSCSAGGQADYGPDGKKTAHAPA
jgi:hypothetical protein